MSKQPVVLDGIAYVQAHTEAEKEQIRAKNAFILESLQVYESLILESIDDATLSEEERELYRSDANTVNELIEEYQEKVQ